MDVASIKGYRFEEFSNGVTYEVQVGVSNGIHPVVWSRSYEGTPGKTPAAPEITSVVPGALAPPLNSRLVFHPEHHWQRLVVEGVWVKERRLPID